MSISLLQRELLAGGAEISDRLWTSVREQWSSFGPSVRYRLQRYALDLLWAEGLEAMGELDEESAKAQKLARAGIKRVTSTASTRGAIVAKELWQAIGDISRRVVEGIFEMGVSALAKTAEQELGRLAK